MRKYTFLGILAVIFWGTNIGFTRLLAESLGGFLIGGIEMLFSGLVLLLIEIVTQRDVRRFLKMPKGYLFGCGALFVSCHVPLMFAIKICTQRSEILVMSAINYLWPILTVLFSVLILHKPYRKLPFYGGLLLTAVATWFICFGGERLNLQDATNPTMMFAAFSAFIAALSWGLYSALLPKFFGLNCKQDSAVCLFMIAAGLCSLLFGITSGERPIWSNDLLFPLSYTLIFPCLLAYWFWDLSMCKGNAPLVTLFSMATVIFSVMFSSLILHVPVSTLVWICSILLVVGTLIVKYASANPIITLNNRQDAQHKEI